jgi:hypothetical protein
MKDGLKSFAQISVELAEAKVKLPSGHKEIKSDSVKVGGKLTSIVYTSYKNKVSVFVNGEDFTAGTPYKDLKTAEKEFKDIKKIMQQMSEETGVSIEEIVNEINI